MHLFRVSFISISNCLPALFLLFLPLYLLSRLRAGGDCETADMITADPKRVKAAGNSFREMTSLGDKEPDQIQVRNKRLAVRSLHPPFPSNRLFMYRVSMDQWNSLPHSQPPQQHL